MTKRIYFIKPLEEEPLTNDVDYFTRNNNGVVIVDVDDGYSFIAGFDPIEVYSKKEYNAISIMGFNRIDITSSAGKNSYLIKFPYNIRGSALAKTMLLTKKFEDLYKNHQQVILTSELPEIINTSDKYIFGKCCYITGYNEAINSNTSI